MNRKTLQKLGFLTLGAALLLATLPVLASTTAPGRQVWDSEDGASPVEITGNIHARILRIEPNRVLSVLAESGEHQIRINEDLPIRAKSKKQFGKKKLQFGDFAPGQWLKVTFLTADGTIRKVHVLPKQPKGVDYAVWTEGAATATLVESPKEQQ